MRIPAPSWWECVESWGYRTRAEESKSLFKRSTTTNGRTAGFPLIWSAAFPDEARMQGSRKPSTQSGRKLLTMATQM
ncbi:hypothetical protein TGARI_371350, partial [Toxoplasma gondii ARI]